MRLLRADTLTRAQRFLIAAAIVIALGLFGSLVYIADVSLAHIELCPVCHIGIVRPSEMVAAKGDVEPSKNLLILEWQFSRFRLRELCEDLHSLLDGVRRQARRLGARQRGS